MQYKIKKRSIQFGLFTFVKQLIERKDNQTWAHFEKL